MLSLTAINQQSINHHYTKQTLNALFCVLFCTHTASGNNLLCEFAMDSDDDEPEIQTVSKRLKPSSDKPTNKSLKFRDAAPSEYFEHFFEMKVSTPRSVKGRTGKLHQGVCKIIAFDRDRGDLT